MSDDYKSIEEYSEYLAHVGVSRMDGAVIGSGRYPLGSGDDPFQHSYTFLQKYDMVRAKYGKDYTKHKKEIADELGITKYNPKTKEYEPYIKGLDRQVSLANNDRRNYEFKVVKELNDKGMNPTDIAKELGFKNESSVRNILSRTEESLGTTRYLVDFLKDQVAEKGIIDVGSNAEQANPLHVSRGKFDDALYLLQKEGYQLVNRDMGQVTNMNQKTKLKLLGAPDTPAEDFKDYSKIHTIEDYISLDDGATVRPAFTYPESMDGSRLKVRYKEDGGVQKDGLVEIRRNVEDLSLGESNYAQVRILVNGTHYIKGMAVYSDGKDMPPGVDVIFNTNKPKGTLVFGPDKEHSVLKPIEQINEHNNNPFGSAIKIRGGQRFYPDPNGKYINPKTGERESLSLINKRAEEGDWDSWGNRLPSQFLSKQRDIFAKNQLQVTLNERINEFAEIKAITNPTVRKEMLLNFADDCDKRACHLDAAALPRQKYQVILPMTTLKDNEVFAPNYKNGEQVALIRFPHGGRFEIPILTVNNNNKEANAIIDKSSSKVDAVGINKNVADRLSGADFDGDTVMVIPHNERVNIASKKQLKGLEGFDPGKEYPGTETSARMKKSMVQRQMGEISNLITDMTLKGATEAELARAVKHSMVVIDANKHEYDYKRSEIDNDIAGLKRKYQKHTDDDGYGGASTLISRAGSEARVPLRQGSPKILPDGSVEYKVADDYKRFYTDDKGKQQERMTKTTKMAVTDDARTLISDYNTKMENYYADYANSLKAMAKEARALYANTDNAEYSKEAYKNYKDVVKDLDDKIARAESNQPRERAAQFRAKSRIKDYLVDDPTVRENKKLWKKIKDQILTQARVETGSNRYTFKLTDKEWEAIQAGAVSHSKLLKIMRYADQADIRERSTPRSYTTLSNVQVARLKRLFNTGNYSLAEIAVNMGISPTTVRKYVGKKDLMDEDEEDDEDGE